MRQFAQHIGVRTTEVYFAGPLDSLNLDTLPHEFVLKPSFASTSIGVLLLERFEDRFRNILSQQVMTLEEIRQSCSRVAERYRPDSPSTARFIVEELLRDAAGNTPPQDVRFYAFCGEIGLVLMEDHLTDEQAHAMYFDGDFLPLAQVHSRYGVAEKATHLEEIVEAKVPRNWKNLLAVAKRISMATPTPFARIDLYDTPKGVYLGEITLTPGTFYYRDRKLMSSTESYRLGRMWADAEERLKGSIGF
ncbi:ATP-grasp fold amidoligase family protein [Kocuria marina]|uniref:ATP-grasp fold amidoligase family protein n=1 Tax=Kocuria marina TaxID=223184 RepID=UPI003460F062